MKQPTLWGDETDLDNAITGQRDLTGLTLSSPQDQETNKQTVLRSPEMPVAIVPHKEDTKKKQPWYLSGQFA